MSNPFLQVHIDAERDSQRKLRTARPLALGDIFEIDDLVMNSTRQLQSVARQVFSSLPTNSDTKSAGISITGSLEGADTPRDAMLRIVRHLLRYHGKDLTKRQKQALEAYDEAVFLGKPPVNYVANKLGILKGSASKLLKRAKMETFGETSYGIGEVKTITWYPSKKEIEHKAASIPRMCACGYKKCTGYTNDGKFAICFPCHVQLKIEYPFSLTPDWVVQEENRIRREHYKQAVDACFKDHYGTISIDEYESYMEAA